MSGEKKSWWRPAVAGGLAGLANGFFGGGGGMILVPLLAGWCGLDQRKALATSVAVILPLCLVSTVIYGLRGSLDWQLAWPYLLGGLGGGFFGGRMFRHLPVQWLRRGLALLLLYAGMKAVFF